MLAFGGGIWTIWVLAAVPVQAQAPELLPERAFAAWGAPVFAENCAPCHGTAGAGDGPVLVDSEHGMIDFGDQAAVSDRTPEAWFQITREGRIEALMPPWSGQLSSAEIGDAVAYLWQLSVSQAMLAQGAALWQTHRTGLADPPGAPVEDIVWARQALSLTTEAWSTLFQSRFRPAVPVSLTPDEMHQMHRYLQSQILVPQWDEPVRAGTGLVSGTVQLLSPDRALPARLPVRLTATVGTQSVREWQAVLDDRHRFSFAGLDTSSRLAYQAHVELDGLSFRSDPVSLEPAGKPPLLRLDVFAPSAEHDTLAIEQMQLILVGKSDRILVGKQAFLVNTEPYVFTGQLHPELARTVTARIPLFVPVADLSLVEDRAERFVVDGDQVHDTRPVYPAPVGSWVTLGYSTALPAGPGTITQDWAYPVRDITVLVNVMPDLQIDLPGFAAEGTREIDAQPFAVWHAASLPDSRLAIRFDRVPARTVPPPDLPVVPLMQPWIPWALAGVLILLILGFAAGPRLRDGRHRTP